MSVSRQIRIITGLTAVVAAFAITAETYNGYTFYASGSYAYLVDMSGNTLHTWKGSGSAVCEAYLLEDGSVLFPLDNRCGVQINGAHPSGRIQKISWDGEVTWDYAYCPSNYGPGYDIEPMPNGNILLPADNTSSAGIIYEIKPSGSSDGEIVWQYALPDSLNSSGGSVGGAGTYINSVSYHPDLDYILVDLQEPVRKLVVIDHSGTGRVVYTFTAATSGRLHGAIWSSPYYIGTQTRMSDADTAAMRTGNLLVVHNSSEVVEVNMNTNTKVKSFSYSFANNEGSVQRLPNGNTLVQKGMDLTTIAELDANGSQIGTITAKGRCSRAYRYGVDYPGAAKLQMPVRTSLTRFTNNSAGTLSYDITSGCCRLTLPSTAGVSVTVRFFSISGRQVFSQRVSGTTSMVSLGALPPGMYHAEVVHATGSFMTSFLKVK